MNTDRQQRINTDKYGQKTTHMDKLNNSKDAKEFLRDLGLYIDEEVVRLVVNVVSGRVHQSLYSLYTTRPNKPVPVCGKGTVDKIKRLYDIGKLQPYIDYISDTMTTGEASNEQIMETKDDVPIEAPSRQESYVETPHKQKMRELAEEVTKYLSLPDPLFSPRVKYPPLPDFNFYEQRSFRETSCLALITKTFNKWARVVSESHLYEGLFCHLRIGELSYIADKINEWILGASNLLDEAALLFEYVEKDLKEEYEIHFCDDDFPVLSHRSPFGIVPHFITSICNYAIHGVQPDISQYSEHSHALLFNGHIIFYEGASDKLRDVMNTHIELINKYIKDPSAIGVGNDDKWVREIEKDVRPELLKFKDVERLPGRCELCS